MANKTISDLRELSTVSDNNVLVVETNDETFKVTKENLLKEVNEELNTKSNINHTHDEYVTESELNAQLSHMEILNVKDYGAKGDGKTDDTEAFKIAFSKASNNCVIEIPSGTYRITDLISQNDVKNLTIKGNGEIQASTYRLFKFTNCDCLTIKGLTIDGMTLSNKGISIYDSNHVLISEVKISNFGSETNDNIGGIEFIGACDYCKVIECIIKNMVASSVAFGVCFSSDSAHTKCPRYCIVDSCVVDTVIPSTDGDGIKFIMLDMETHSTISNCKILNCDKRAIKLQCRYIDVYNCYCEGKMTYASVDFQYGYGTLNDCKIIHTAPVYIGVAICGENVTLNNVEIKSKEPSTADNSAGVRIMTMEDADYDLGTIELNGVYISNLYYGIMVYGENKHIEKLIITNCTLDGMTGTYLIHLGNSTVDFIQVEHLYIKNKPSVVYNVFFNFNAKNCLIQNNNTSGIRLLSDSGAFSNKNIICLENRDTDDTYNVPYTQRNTKKFFEWNTSPMNVEGGRADVFKASKIGDECINTNISVKTDEDKKYIISKWVCTEEPSTSYPKGVWKELRDYVY